MPTCNNCGTFVTPAFARVFGSNQDEVFACLECGTRSEIADRTVWRTGQPR